MRAIFSTVGLLVLGWPLGCSGFAVCVQQYCVSSPDDSDCLFLAGC